MINKVLITGGAGFIGSHLVEYLLEEGVGVTILDNFDSFYSETIKRKNIEKAMESKNIRLLEIDIRDLNAIRTNLNGSYDVIVHLAARAGVRPSIQDPVGYLNTNVNGTQNMLEFAKEREVRQFIFASSSSVYGINPNTPWREDNHVLMPISPYASTKVSGELMGHVYSHLYGIRFLALRFFTVYGPRQRPDLAISKFARLMLEGKPIPIFGDGSTRRDYTYIDDIIKGIRAAMNYEKTSYEVINLGNNHTVSLNEMITTLQKALGVEASIDQRPLQAGDVPLTWACMDKAASLLHFAPTTSFCHGVAKFIEWMRAK